MLGRPLFAITQADLDALLPRDEEAPLRQRIREHVRDWFSTRADRLDGQTTVSRHVLMEACGLAPDALLLLAFNRSAAKEIANRLERMGCAAPHIMTFHALSVAIYRPDAEILTDVEDDQGRSRLKGSPGSSESSSVMRRSQVRFET